MATNDGGIAFEHDLFGNPDVDLSKGSRRVYALLEPEEAKLLLDKVEDEDLSDSSINKESLQYRLGLAAGGQEPPQSGEAAFYQ